MLKSSQVEAIVLAAPVVRRFSANSLIAVTGMALIGLLHHAGPRWPRHPCERHCRRQRTNRRQANPRRLAGRTRLRAIDGSKASVLWMQTLAPRASCAKRRDVSAWLWVQHYRGRSDAFFRKCSLGNPRRRSARLQAGASRLWADPANKLLLPPE